jgi:hypothetical protein
MRSASEWRQITVAELRAFLFEAHLLALIGCVAIDYALRHALNVREPYAMSVAFFWASMTQLPVLTVRSRDRGKPMPVFRYVAASVIGSVLFIGVWFLFDRVI